MHTRLRKLAILPPPQARARVAHLRDRMQSRGDILMMDALDLLARLLAARAWLRHDPECQHRSPTHLGEATCTCGLSNTLYGPVALTTTTSEKPESL